MVSKVDSLLDHWLTRENDERESNFRNNGKFRCIPLSKNHEAINN